jgi:uncharacterized protein (DUF2147 family)
VAVGFGRIAIAVGLVWASMMPALASPVGLWEIETGDQRYNVTMCGDGTQLCAELIWLGKGGDRPENRPYLNTLMIDRAPLIRPNQWRGKLNLYGKTATGTITQIAEDLVQLKGCYFLVMCRTYKMYRIEAR